jgi:hypothetical protein
MGKAPSDTSKSPPGSSVTLFPPASKTALVRNKKLDEAVAKAVGNLVKAKSSSPTAKFGITIVDPTSNYAMGGFNDDKEFYCASLVKMAVMWAAFGLRDMVRRYNSLRGPKTSDALFKGLRADMDDRIEHSSPLIFGGASHAYRVPNYEYVFHVKELSGKLTVEFSHAFAVDVANMIVNGKNDSTANCVHGLGYGYVNGLLEQGGFFNSKDKKGIWVGGDFLAWPTVEIPCINDVETHQGGTTETFARLIAVILTDSVIPGDSHGMMTKLLSGAAHGPEPSFLTRKEHPDHRLTEDQVSHVKIGKGPLKGNKTDVFSEACFLKNVAATGGTYIASYANIDFNPYSLGDITGVIEDAIAIYES